MTRIRERTLSGFPATSYAHHTHYKDGTIAYTSTVSDPGNSGIETITDETHPGPPYRSGGPMILSRTRYFAEVHPYDTITRYWLSTGAVRSSASGIMRTQLGPYCASKDFPYWTLPTPRTTSRFNESELIALGTEGWNRYRPLKPKQDLPQTIAELKGVSHLLTSVRQDIKEILTLKDPIRALASGNLSWQFALKPLLNDIDALSNGYEFADKRIKYMIANNGKLFKRGGPLRKHRESQEGSMTYLGGGLFPVPTEPFLVEDSIYRAEHYRADVDVWFEGVFGFHIPVTRPPLWEAKARLRQQYGISLHPIAFIRLVYQLTPWTWLLDWFASTGDILSNMVAHAEDGVYSRYAYVMAKERYSLKATTGPFGIEGHGSVSPLSTEKITEFKNRRSASPFGFGIAVPEDLSLWQIGILGSLGLAR